MRVCPLCDMPHHIECWQENGGCTTLGCKCQSTSGWVEENSRIVIDLEDLEADGHETYGCYSHKVNHKFESKTKSDSPLDNPFTQLVLAGLVGGLITWLLALLIFNFNYYADIANYKQVLIEIAFFASVLGGVVGATLSSLEGITGKVTSKLIYGLVSGLTIGAAGGFIGAIIGQIFYSSIDTTGMLTISLFTLRGIFWGLVGMFIGISQGIGSGGGKRLSNGIVGGLIGGFVSGFLFDFFFLVFSSAALSGFLAITFFGIFTGIAIGTVQEIRKEAWLKVLTGETAGKEYIIYNDKTIIGSASKCDIVLIKDNNVSKQHAEILMSSNSYFIKTYPGAKLILLGNRNINQAKLKNYDIISIGKYRLQFFEKTMSK